ncbi:MAG: hypothetical protein OEL55_01565 [Desulfobulbaceae bacterium]|nr:hypothetical protein [Desulfobulbaceae bacterium]
MKQIMVTSACSLTDDNLVIDEQLEGQLRRADHFATLAVACGQAALKNGPEKEYAKDRIGTFIGTTYGPLETNFSSLGSLIEQGEGYISPTLFSHSVYNSAAGYISRLFGIHGQALTITTYTWPFLTALNQARLSILAGRIDKALVLGVETYSELLSDACCRAQGIEKPIWRPGAGAMVLETGNEFSSGLCALGRMDIEETPCESSILLARDNEEWTGQDLSGGLGSHPLAHVYDLIDGVTDGRGMAAGNDWQTWNCRASFGSVSLALRR